MDFSFSFIFCCSFYLSINIRYFLSLCFYVLTSSAWPILGFFQYISREKEFSSSPATYLKKLETRPEFEGKTDVNPSNRVNPQVYYKVYSPLRLNPVNFYIRPWNLWRFMRWEKSNRTGEYLLCYWYGRKTFEL